jgi:hypothetical protein
MIIEIFINYILGMVIVLCFHFMIKKQEISHVSNYKKPKKSKYVSNTINKNQLDFDIKKNLVKYVKNNLTESEPFFLNKKLPLDNIFNIDNQQIYHL